VPPPGVPPAVLPCGETALLVEVGGIREVLALHAALEALGPERLPGLADLVPAATTLLVVAESPAVLTALRSEVTTVLASSANWTAGGGPSAPVRARSDVSAATGDVVEIAVHYDGEDLREVARHTGLSPDEVVAAHTGSTWTAAFGGFAPGFAYLAGGDPRLEVPRRSEPRTRVPSGAVGLAGSFSGIYPRSSPGGWQIIGHTDVVVWDLERDPPALLRPGVRVRFTTASTDSRSAGGRRG
jgi:KipI family sensor histidine kinase inhibitor